MFVNYLESLLSSEVVIFTSNDEIGGKLIEIKGDYILIDCSAEKDATHTSAVVISKILSVEVESEMTDEG